MHRLNRVNDAVHMFMGDLTSRLVAESGRAEDRFHLGKMILQSLKDAPDHVMQIDGGTGEMETNASALKRTVQCATAMKNVGLGCGDVIALMAPNHLDLAIPFYAAFYLGVAVAAVDRALSVKELQDTFRVIKPKLIFCQSEKAPDIQLALNQLDLGAEIVTFDKGEFLCSFPKFLEKYSDDKPIEEFRAADFDPDTTIATLIPTSGTTGIPKSAAISHKNFSISCPYLWSRYTKFPTPTRMALIGSPLQWLTAILHYIISPIMKYTRLQTSGVFNPEHAVYLIRKYKPTYMVLSPIISSSLLKFGDEECDFTSFELILLGGSAVPPDLIDEIKKRSPHTEVFNVFGMTELTTVGFHTEDPPPGSCGKPIGCFQYRIVNAETQQDVTEPNVRGELWVKGPAIFKGYYNNPKATLETFAEDGWFKTGDMFYRDEHWNFFFVERIKLLLKYKSHQISPVELETVIRGHPGVQEVAVTGIPDPELGDLPVACVVRRPGHDVAAQDIKDLVKESLSESKQLHGGVVFFEDLPMTASAKINRKKLKEMIVKMERE
ncbi:luciferin 4-monooxygenase-like [Pectinophora gossypiella]|uniref:luciferin 4-monooxygenase-like n=1 Tax=Pectinophora gossypiella TaxID=13191 RepID=UPI00214F3B6D|nr:luciferin 4-monooxygenase-like [Pectinophora gossypiella]